MTAETPAGRARRLLEGATGLWTLQVEPDYGVDSSGSAPGRRTVVLARGTPIASDLLASEEELALMAAAPDLARDLIDAELACEMTRGSLNEADQEIAAAWSALGTGPGGTLAEAITLLAAGWVERCARVERERDEARAELAAAQDRLTWPRWMEAWDGSYGLVPSDGGPYLAIVSPEDGMWRPWLGLGCREQQSPGGFDEAETYLVDLGHIRAGCTIRPCAGGAR